MIAPLSPYLRGGTCIEAGVDEAGRGCLAGPVFAAAVILPHPIPEEITLHLNDSKKLSAIQRFRLRLQIQHHALAFATGMATHEEIDRINILNASFLAMHRAIEKLKTRPALLLIDGNRFKPFSGIEHCCIVKGDGLYFSIAAASVLAKTARDDFMLNAHGQYPMYHWDKNKGYPTPAHKRSIAQHGLSPLHRKSFNHGMQLKM
ncbi:MAG: ribonuclease HII, partial [Bacteroidetes bacterium]